MQSIARTGRLDDIVSRFPGKKQSLSDGSVMVCCQGRGHDDHTPSLHLSETSDGYILVKCMSGCETADAIGTPTTGLTMADLMPPSSGIEPQRVVATYIYHDPDGNPVSYKDRFGPVKGFSQGHFTPSGQKVAGMKGVARYLYRANEIAASGSDEWIFVVGGEKDANRGEQEGLQTTTNSEGEGKWRPEYSESLAGKKVVIIPDNDETGEKHVEVAAPSLSAHGCQVRVVRLPGLPPKGDLSDWFDQGHTREELFSLVETTPAWSLDDVATACEANNTNLRRAVVRNLADVSERKPEWVWPGYIPRGMVTILGGYPGDGKSHITVALAAALSRGGSTLPDGSPAPLLNTMFLAAEDLPEVTIKPRFMAHNGDPGRVILIEGTEEENKQGWINIKRDLDLLREEIIANDIGLLVIDPISSYMPGSNRNQEGDVRDSLQPLVQLAAETDVAIVCVAHIGKGMGASRPAQRVMGATAFVGVARVVIMVDTIPENLQPESSRYEEEPSPRRVLQVVKSNIAKEPPPIMFSIQERVIWHGPAPMSIQDIMEASRDSDIKPKKEQASEWLRDFLKDGERPQRDVARASEDAGIAWATIRRAKSDLHVALSKKGGSNGSWWWSLPESPTDSREHLEHLSPNLTQDEHLTKQTNLKDVQMSTFENAPQNRDFSDPDTSDDPSVEIKDAQGAQHAQPIGGEHLCDSAGCPNPRHGLSRYCTEHAFGKLPIVNQDEIAGEPRQLFSPPASCIGPQICAIKGVCGRASCQVDASDQEVA